MKFNNLFFMALVLVLICSCKDTTLCYKIPLDNKELVICIPAFSDYAYLYIDAHESYVPTDSFDFKINNRGEATEVSLILNKHKDDTIYYSDRWNQVILVNKNGKYKRVSWHDDRFYTKDIRTNKIQINQNYIEIVIKDYATPDFDYASPILKFPTFHGQNRHFCLRLVSSGYQTRA